MSPNAIALVPVMQFEANPDDGIVLTGIVHGRRFYEFPAKLDAFPVISVWSGIRKGFEQTTRLINPRGEVISLLSLPLDGDKPNHYGVCIAPLEASIPEPGKYLLELFAGRKLWLSKPVQFVSSPTEIFSVPHEPQLSALLFAESVTGRDDLEKVRMARVMNYNGLDRKKSITIVTVWDNVRKSFDAELQLISPSGSSISKATFRVEVKSERNVQSVMYIDLPAMALREAGVYQVRVRYEGKYKAFPLIVR